MEVLVEMKGICKAFPGVKANNQVNFSLKAGEIHALLGENGAGKSTLMSILTGLYRADQGEIWIRGQKVNFRSPRDAIRAGIGMVHQHFKLVAPFTVTENVALGLPGQGIGLKLREIEAKLSQFAAEYGLLIHPQAKVWQLSIGEQQRVEIVKLLFRGTDILILDEPTAVLTPQEARELYRILRRMAEAGKGIIVITHKLQEVLDHADTITVMRGGRSIATLPGAEATEQGLARLMVGKEPDIPEMPAGAVPGPVLLELKAVTALGDRGQPALKQVSLTVRAGEILGIAGVAGNGQRELAEVIAGLRPLQSGQLFLAGQEMGRSGPRERIAAGVAYIPEDRLGTGLVPNLDVRENILLKHYRDREFTRGPLINWQRLTAYSSRLVDEFAVKISDLTTPVKTMSGGNLQKLLLAREISSRPRLIVAVYLVRGLDIAATLAVRTLLLQARRQGCGVVLISEELEELFQLADRLAVLHEGEITGLVPVREARMEEIGLMMAGKMVKSGCA